MKKLLALIICFWIVFVPMTASADSKTEDKITVSNEECLNIIREKTDIYKDYIDSARQVGNAGRHALILACYTVDSEMENTYIFLGFNIITPGNVVMLYVYDGESIYEMYEAVNNKIVTMDEIYYGFDHKGCASIMKIEPTVYNPIERIEKSINIGELRGYRLPRPVEDVEIINGEDTHFFKIIPDENGKLYFSSKGNGGKTYRYIYNDEMKLLDANDSESYGTLSFKVEAGKTYVLAVSMLTASLVGEKPLKTMVFKLDFEPEKGVEPSVTTPVVTEPVTTEPAVTKPAATEPTANGSAAEIPNERVKKSNPVKVTVKSVSIMAKKLKEKAQRIKPITVKKAQGKVNCKLAGAPEKIKKYLKINSKGVITFAKWKKAEKSTYKLKVRITAGGNDNYKAKTVIKMLKVRIE